MGAPVGNQNAAKAKEWADAIRYVRLERERNGARGSLRDIAGVLIDKCLEGDLAALKEFGERTDGKVPQGIGGTEELPPLQVTWAPEKS